eukprot:CAMPEP_0170132460 /NCGR_PEP_ID=MMETSP0033_2-20121228/284_1 /TAXON_ID=195969 /ORGANISM="Dolichomastix tenuilepis, Strain CCMP3274" /LENGTH=818 /DNA_ID=CAMNT_0010367823 /DNA_START=36 /DNA_END=2489 /DNA_ORIENTATION=+
MPVKHKKHRRKAPRQAHVALPTELEVDVLLPGGRKLELKGVSSDTIGDLRAMLGDHPAFCHSTRFALAHASRGASLPDSQDLAHLKPPFLSVVEAPYDARAAEAHVRRLLDILSSLHLLGRGRSAGPPDAPEIGSAGAPEEKTGGAQAQAAADGAERRRKSAIAGSDGGNLCEAPRLGAFYEFFSTGHLASPLKTCRRLARRPGPPAFFLLELVDAADRTFAVTAGPDGFWLTGKHESAHHTLVALLRHHSETFRTHYAALMQAFAARNEFGNLPIGLRANTWVAPPALAAAPGAYRALPAEAPHWGGGGGGFGLEDPLSARAWRADFRLVASMPGATADERALRDRRAFLLHQLFLDRALHLAARTADAAAHAGEARRELRAAGLSVVAERHAERAELSAPPEQRASLKALLKGLCSDENTAACDVEANTTATVFHRGYRVTVTALEAEEAATALIPESEEPVACDGGAGSLNPGTFRALLHAPPPAELLHPAAAADAAGRAAAGERVATEAHLTPAPFDGASEADATAEAAELELLKRGEELLGRVLRESEDCLQAGDAAALEEAAFRWEFGSSWVQRVKAEQDKRSAAASSSSAQQKTPSGIVASGAGDDVVAAPQASAGLTRALGAEAAAKLAASGTGVHALESEADVLAAGLKWYEDGALPALMDDFASLELAPVDSRTLTDFMHSRGINMRKLGRVQASADEAGMPHIRDLCMVEAVARSLKRVLRAVMAAATAAEAEAAAPTGLTAAGVAAVFNAALGSARASSPLGKELWSLVRRFALVRFGAVIPREEEVSSSEDDGVLAEKEEEEEEE